MEKVKVTLTEDYLWHGEMFEAGDREIPEGLAIALGLKPATVKKPAPKKEEE